MILTNYQVYEYAQIFDALFETQDLYIPVKANFIIQKNIEYIQL